jgi:hypothetical protein
VYNVRTERRHIPTAFISCSFEKRTITNKKITTDQIFCIRQILEKKWEYNEAIHQIFVDFKQAYDSVRREVLYNILIEFGVS